MNVSLDCPKEQTPADGLTSSWGGWRGIILGSGCKESYFKNIDHLLSTYYVTGTMVRALHTLFHSVLILTSMYFHFSDKEMELIGC